jgi:hypothetical protein
MPSYDIACTACGYEDLIVMPIADLAAWDHEAICPKCNLGGGALRRIIKYAAAVRCTTANRSSINSVALDEMKHKNLKHHDADKIENAREIVKSGAYEGF